MNWNPVKCRGNYTTIFKKKSSVRRYQRKGICGEPLLPSWRVKLLNKNSMLKIIKHCNISFLSKLNLSKNIGRCVYTFVESTVHFLFSFNPRLLVISFIISNPFYRYTLYFSGGQLLDVGCTFPNISLKSSFCASA